MRERAVKHLLFLTGLLFSGVIPGLVPAKATLSFNTTNLEQREHTNLVIQLFDEVGLPPGAGFEGILHHFGEEEIALACSLAKKYEGWDGQDILGEPAEWNRKKYRGRVLLLYDIRFNVDCSQYEAIDLPFDRLLVLLIHFWNTDSISITGEGREVWAPFYARARPSSTLNLFARNATSSDTLNAVVITTLSEPMKQVLEMVTKRQVIHASMNAIDANPLLAAFDNLLFQAFFSFLFPCVYFTVALRGLFVIRLRMMSPQKDSRIFLVLGLNVFTSLLLGVILALDGYASRGNFSSAVSNSFRGLLFGASCAGDSLLASVWVRTLSQMKMFGKVVKKSRCLFIYFELLTVCLVSLDIVSILGFFDLIRLDFFILTPALIFVAQTLINLYFTKSTIAVIRLLNFSSMALEATKSGRGASSPSSPSSPFGGLIRHLAKMIRMSVLCSVLIQICTAFMLVPGLYLGIFGVHFLVNAVLILARACNSYTQIEFCSPVHRRAVAPRATVQQTTNTDTVAILS